MKNSGNARDIIKVKGEGSARKNYCVGREEEEAVVILLRDRDAAREHVVAVIDGGSAYLKANIREVYVVWPEKLRCWVVACGYYVVHLDRLGLAVRSSEDRDSDGRMNNARQVVL